MALFSFASPHVYQENHTRATMNVLGGPTLERSRKAVRCSLPSPQPDAQQRAPTDANSRHDQRTVTLKTQIQNRASIQKQTRSMRER
ncbi:hypothetical protein AcV5_010531 [Taiwanofungus camphoratus]|nr:hypothetical protein AcV5_010531 [Antrodia cinnamomea]